MKWWKFSITGFLILLVLTGCRQATEAIPAVSGGEQYTSKVLRTDYDNALTVRNQLALGTLRLDETAVPLTADEAATLLPLWQGLRGTIANGAASITEVDALLEQIEGSLSQAQLQAIADMHLTRDDLTTWAQSQGITVPAVGNGGAGGGPGRNLTEEERAARQAEQGGPGSKGNGINTILIDQVISYLETLSGSTS